jgi:hypothetical protein
MKIKAIGHLVKTNPIQSQTKPILERIESSAPMQESLKSKC